MLYSLILTDPELSYDNYSEDFDIGIFTSESQAEETARYYLKNVKGFCDFPCTYRIVKRKIVNNFDNIAPESIWIVHGWNTNENLDEIDIVESPCFLTEDEANSELRIMKSQYHRTEWSISCWKVGDLKWEYGFVRMEGDLPMN